MVCHLGWWSRRALAVTITPCAAQVVLVVDRYDAALLSQVGLEAPCRPSTSPTPEGKQGVDEVEVEIAEQPTVVGLDDSVHLNHDAVGRQLLPRHEKGARSCGGGPAR